MVIDIETEASFNPLVDKMNSQKEELFQTTTTIATLSAQFYS
jgi:hypothetical protein